MKAELPTIGKISSEIFEQVIYPRLGRKLRQLLVAAGLHSDVGVLPSLWDSLALRESFEREWTWIAHDVGTFVPASELERARSLAQTAIEAGTRLTYLPLFYAMAKKPAL